VIMEQNCRREWHVITSEYPPDIGGVGDYSSALASALVEAGDKVHVWCRPSVNATSVIGLASNSDRVMVHRELGAIGLSDLRRVSRLIGPATDCRTLLVQWVPHAFGYRSMNLGFCWWLLNRSVHYGDRVAIMVHEPYLAFHVSRWKQNVAALVHRIMTILLLRAAERVWVSIPEWERCWRPYTLGRKVPFGWLPVPSNIPVADSPNHAEAVRRRYAANDAVLIGHFGTYGWPVTSVLEPVLFAMDADPANQVVLLMGIGSEEFRERLIRKMPRFVRLVQATGVLPAEDLSHHVAACDLLIQPYPDGVSSRRGSVMVGLCHGKPIITTAGRLTEPFWKDTSALALVPVGDVNAFVDLLRQLRLDVGQRARIGRAARSLYDERFDIGHIITTLRRAASAPENSVCAS
jgi:glycosyltransferase involved in cell wall biosynthesis